MSSELRRLIVGGSIVLVACTARRAPIADGVAVAPTAADTHTVVGVLDAVVGDPTSPSSAERVKAAIVDSSGRRTPLVLLRAQFDALGPGARQPGVRVRVTGQRATLEGAPALRVIAIAIAPFD